jgi:hypothetical protein
MKKTKPIWLPRVCGMLALLRMRVNGNKQITNIKKNYEVGMILIPSKAQGHPSLMSDEIARVRWDRRAVRTGVRTGPDNFCKSTIDRGKIRALLFVFPYRP